MATGMEAQTAQDSGQVICAQGNGESSAWHAREIRVRYDGGEEKAYPLIKFVRSNQGTCISQRPIVEKGERVVNGQPLADSSSTEGGELALGQSVLAPS